MMGKVRVAMKDGKEVREAEDCWLALSAIGPAAVVAEHIGDLVDAGNALRKHIKRIEYRDKAQLRLGPTVPHFERFENALAALKREDQAP